ncbi:hypothetical protein CB1_002638001 [Camelus ferus]|nr:hypothetical protein CB1_002638001 [Camelus ferus]
MPREPEMNKEHDRKDVPVSSKHSCVEKHEDMWVKQGKFDWKSNSEFIRKKSNQKISKIHEKGKITFHRKVESLHDNSELHGDLKELPSSVTDNIFDHEEKDAPGASVSVGVQAVSEHKEPSLEDVFPSYSKSESTEYGCQSFSKLYFNENKLDENDKPDTEHVFNKNEENFYNDRENEVRNRVPYQEFDTKRIQKRHQNTHWKSDIGHAPQVNDPKSLFGLWLARSVEVEENRNKSSELKGSETMCDGSYHKGLTQQRKRGKTDDQQFPALQKGGSDRSSKKMSTKKNKVKEQMNSVDGLDDLTLSPETASKDCESLFPNYKNTLRLIEQLGPESKDSDRLLKIQDPVHSFRSIELKESDSALLRGKIKEMENKDTKDFELSDPEDNNEVLPQQLPEAGSQFRGQEMELHPRRDALRPMTLVLECVHRDLAQCRGQAQRSNKGTEPLSQSKQGEVNKYIGKQAFLEKRVYELQSENMLLRQQLEVAQNEARSKKTILNIPEPFPDHMGKLEAMSRRVLMLEGGNKELINECRCLTDCISMKLTEQK